MPRLFISYSRADTSFADHLNDRLEQLGLETFLDRDDIHAGESWVRRIQNALETSDAMLLLLSPEAMESKYVESEWVNFQSSNRPIFPLYVRPCKIPFALGTLQYVTFHGRDFEAAFADLKAELVNQGYVAREEKSPAPATPPPVATPPKADPLPPLANKPKPLVTAPTQSPQVAKERLTQYGVESPPPVRTAPTPKPKKSSPRIRVGYLIPVVLLLLGVFTYFAVWPLLDGSGKDDDKSGDKGLSQSPEENPPSDYRLAYMGGTDESNFTIKSMALDGTDIQQITDLGEDIAHFAVSPDGQQIALITHALHMVEVMNLDGSQRRTLVPADAGPGRVFYRAAWSPDGQTIALVGDIDGVYDVLLVDIQSKQLQALTSDADVEMEVAWSPDGKELAVLKQLADTSKNVILLIEPANRQRDLLTTLDPMPGQGGLAWSPDGQIWYATQDSSTQEWTLCSFTPRLEGYVEDTAHNDLHGGLPAFSPDGRYMAYVVVEGEAIDLVIANADGSNPHRFSRGGTLEGFPAWISTTGDVTTNLTTEDPNTSVQNPAGTIAFSMADESGVYQIYTVNSDATNLQQLTTAGGIYPTWSPDGSQIAFVAERNNRTAIHIMSADGSGQRSLFSQGTFTPREIAWSPDGTQVAAILENLSDNTTDVWLIKLPYGSYSQLSYTSDTEDNLAWSPDGSQLAVLIETEQFQNGVDEARIDVLSIADGTPLYQFQPNPVPTSYGGLAWSPDGSNRLLYTHVNTETSPIEGQIYAVDLGTTEAVLIPVGELASNPRTTSSGQFLLFINWVDPQNSEQVIMLSDLAGQSVSIVYEPSQIGLKGMAWKPE